MVLKKAGFRIDASVDIEEGLWYIESFDYDVVILDLMLQGTESLSIIIMARKKILTAVC